MIIIAIIITIIVISGIHCHIHDKKIDEANEKAHKKWVKDMKKWIKHMDSMQ